MKIADGKRFFIIYNGVTMGSDINKRTFFLPEAVKSRQGVIHSSCVRLSQYLLERSHGQSLLVPIEAMNYLAILQKDKLYFVDLNSHEQTENARGSQIVLSWQPHSPEEMDFNTQHLPVELTCYSNPIAETDKNLEQIQQQLTGEFYKALMLLDSKFSGQKIPSDTFTIRTIRDLHG